MPDHPIKDYGLIGNCETCALVNARGGIDWLCLPTFDGGSFFGALLDHEKGGDFSIEPLEPCTVTRTYRDDTAILETRFATSSGTVLLTDFFVVARSPKARFYDFTSLQPTRKLVRTISLESGQSARLRLAVRARPDFARRSPAWQAVAGGYNTTDAAIFSSLPLTITEGD